MTLMRRFLAALAFAALTLAGPVQAQTSWAQHVTMPGFKAGMGFVGGCTDTDPAFDFTTGIYCLNGISYPTFATVPGATVTRASQGYALNSNGEYVSFASGVARITDFGLLVEEQRINRLTINNYDPQVLTGLTKSGAAAATLTLVTDPTEMTAIGLSGNVFKLDNSAGGSASVVTFSGTPGSTNPFIFSTLTRGSGTFQFFLGGNAGGVKNLTTGYSRQWSGITPAASGSVPSIQLATGGVMYFVLTGLEEGTWITSPIVVAGATATRATDVVTVGGLSLAANSGSSLVAHGLPQAPNTFVTSQLLAEVNSGTSANRININRVATTNTVRYITTQGGADQYSNAGAAWSQGAIGGAAMYEATGAQRGAFNGTLATAGSSVNRPIFPFTTIYFGSNPAGVPWNGYVRRVKFKSRALSDAEIQAESTP